MRGIHVILGGVHDFAKACPPGRTFPALMREAYDHAIADIGK